MKRLGILLSGRGSNFLAIADSVAAGRLNAEISLVVSNLPNAPGLTHARSRGLNTLAIPSKGLAREAHDRFIIDALQQTQVDLVCLAGYMRLVSPLFLEAFPQRILNIHPSLLPSFPGLHPQQQALDYGVKFSGCTVHFVDLETDSGPIIQQAVVPVLDSDTAETLAARILIEEHRIYSEAIGRVLEGKLRVTGRRVLQDAGL
jgi:phosphoribosylglycinamide formyltransferase-1